MIKDLILVVGLLMIIAQAQDGHPFLEDPAASASRRLQTLGTIDHVWSGKVNSPFD